MPNTQDRNTGSSSGIELILGGLVLALLGAGSVMLMAVGLSLLYVGCYGLGGVLLVGFLLAGSLFAAIYGRYLDRLERRTGEPTTASSLESPGRLPAAAETDVRDGGVAAPSGPTTSPQEPAAVSSAPAPAPASRVISLATAAYGLLIVVSGLIWTRGADLMYNVLAGAALLACAVVIWRGGRGRVSTSSRALQSSGFRPAADPHQQHGGESRIGEDSAGGR